MNVTGKLYRASLLNQGGNCAYGMFHNATQEKKKLISFRKIFLFIYFFFDNNFFLRSTEVLLLGNCFYNASINGPENLGM